MRQIIVGMLVGIDPKLIKLLINLILRFSLLLKITQFYRVSINDNEF